MEEEVEDIEEMALEINYLYIIYYYINCAVLWTKYCLELLPVMSGNFNHNSLIWLVWTLVRIYSEQFDTVSC